MRALWQFVLLTGSLASTVTPPPARVDPKLLSVYPFCGRPETSFQATVRGNGVRGATSAFFDYPGVAIAVESAESETPTTGGNAKNQADLVRIQVRVSAGAQPGRVDFRLVTPQGASNALPIYVADDPVAVEPPGAHDTAESAVPLDRIPAVVTGRIAQRGEADYYAFDVKTPETLTFEVTSGLPSLGGPGGNARGFDPALTVFEPSRSWFDPQRLRRIAFNDEPLWVIGRLTDAHLVHRFTRPGRYWLRVEAFSGQGGPDYGYALRVRTGSHPPPDPADGGLWDERSFTRGLTADRPNELAARGGKARELKSVETYRAAAAPVGKAPTFRLPATLEGALAQAGETHRARFQLDGPQDIAIEVETPQAAPPVFNPIVRLLNAAGEEVATNVLAGRGACTGALFKSLQAKAIVPLRDPGEYVVEVRDTTADLAQPDFRYRVQLRPQVPHLGQVRIEEDHLNLAPAETRTVRVTFDREEDYRGAVAVAAESLPPGVQALAGADFEPDKDPPLHPGKRERYLPRSERTVVVFAAAPDAPPTARPQVARLVVRPAVDGRLGEVLLTKPIPIMVVAKP